MSYILGALSKAEKDRKRDRALDLQDWDQQAWEPPECAEPSKNRLLWLICLILLLVLVLFVWLAYQIILSPSTQIPQSESPAVQQLIPSAAKPTSTTMQLPQNAQADVPAPQTLPAFSGSIYFPNKPSLSRVFSGAKSLRERDMINGYRIEEIAEQQVLLSLGAQRFTVKFE